MNQWQQESSSSFLARMRKPTLRALFRPLSIVLRLAAPSGVGLVVDILAWQFPKWRIPYRWWWILCGLGFSVVFALGHLLWLWRRHVGRLEATHDVLRKVILSSANVDHTACDDPRYPIAGVSDRSGTGTVHLVLDRGDSLGLQLGSRLDVIATKIDEVWGTVVVCEESDHRLWVTPTDRAKPEFWEKLEDRMRSDPLPPSGFHLEPSMSSELRQILNLAMSERKRHDI